MPDVASTISFVSRSFFSLLFNFVNYYIRKTPIEKFSLLFENFPPKEVRYTRAQAGIVSGIPGSWLPIIYALQILLGRRWIVRYLP